MTFVNNELTQELMADEILSIFKINKIKVKEYIDAGTLLLSFRANINGLQSGMDWLTNKGLIRQEEFKPGLYFLTASGYVKNS